MVTKKEVENIVDTKIKSIVNDEIDKFINNALDKEISKLLKSNNSKTRKEHLDTIKSAMESVYKMMWVKRDFWKSDIG